MTPDKATRVALIHATPLAVAPINEAFARLWPSALVTNLLDDSLSADLARAGQLDDAMIQRFETLGDYVASTGARAILFTCSAFGPAIEAVAQRLAPMPVLKPNEAMFAEAIAAGGAAALVATFPPSLPSMTAEFEAMAAAADVAAPLTTVCAEGAMEALAAGDGEEHDARIGDAARKVDTCDVIMLAQFSMARAKGAAEAAAGTKRILTSPDSAVRRLQVEMAQL